jgi:methanogenic corrinoid protein MtbC1
MSAAAPGDDLAAALLVDIRAGRRRAALDLVRARLEPATVADARAVVRALAEVQARMGAAWQRSEASVAEEHTATLVVDDALAQVAEALPEPSPDRSVALVCAEGEWHVTPARMAGLLLRAAGWHVTFLGGSVPPEHVRETLDLLRPDVVAVSCTVPMALPGAGRVAAATSALGLRVLAGGRAFGTDDHRARMLGLDGWAPDVDVAVRTLEGWLTVLPARPVPSELDGEELTLELREPEIVEAALARLRPRGGAAREPRAEHRARRDLGALLTVVRVALQCDDETVLTDYASWRRRMLAARGVSDEALRAGPDALLEAAAGLPRTQRLLRGCGRVAAR